MRPWRRLLLTGIAAGFFVAWVGWLGVLALTTRHSVVLSRPQLLITDVAVVAAVPDPKGPVEIREVCWPPGVEGPTPGEKLTLENLNQSRPSWQGPADYIVPLRRREGGYEVAPIPLSPGYFPPVGLDKSRQGPPRIYPATPETLAQLRAIAK